jgi:hydrogenase maturation protease
MPPLPATLVIGYGNDLRSDDGAGIRAASILAENSPQSHVIITHQLTPDLAEDIASEARVVFVDAYAAQETGAKLRIEKISGEAVGSLSAMGHHGDPANLLHLADLLFGKIPDAWVVGIPASSFDMGDTISPETLQMIDEAVALIGGSAFSKQ